MQALLFRSREFARVAIYVLAVLGRRSNQQAYLFRACVRVRWWVLTRLRCRYERCCCCVYSYVQWCMESVFVCFKLLTFCRRCSCSEKRKGAAVLRARRDLWLCRKSNNVTRAVRFMAFVEKVISQNKGNLLKKYHLHSFQPTNKAPTRQCRPGFSGTREQREWYVVRQSMFATTVSTRSDCSHSC